MVSKWLLTALVILLVTCIEIILGSIGFMLLFKVAFPIASFGLGKAVLASIATMLIVGPLNAKLSSKGD